MESRSPSSASGTKRWRRTNSIGTLRQSAASSRYPERSVAGYSGGDAPDTRSARPVVNAIEALLLTAHR